MADALTFERISIKGEEPVKRALWRTKVPGGWLVRSDDGDRLSMLFLPDAAHTWDVAKLTPTLG